MVDGVWPDLAEHGLALIGLPAEQCDRDDGTEGAEAERQRQRRSEHQHRQEAHETAPDHGGQHS
ncbi:hypothetical protein [Nesterenkonia marinintestina]|uniref:hypothetical protein n=1 Tax=Nesterenkonia marinintestina TaxID=2979865 RepID=UPI0021BFDF4A|nr:hypothetical protein [Nesterenkonia sp. GX14115]